MALTELKDWAAVLGCIIALVALAKGVLEYGLQGAQKRAAQFAAMRQRFEENERFRELCALLETDDPSLAAVPLKDKRDLLAFFEEVALVVQSRLVRETVAHYMFGYYAIRCWESENFWDGVNRQCSYWALFRHFARRMRELETRSTFRPRELRF